MKRFAISVPASSANIGPGFDSAGLALNRYLTLEVSGQEKWEITQDSDFLPPITHYEDHFIYETAKQIAEQHNEILPACKVNIKRSEEHTSELQSRGHLVCRLLLEKKESIGRCRWSKKQSQ